MTLPPCSQPERFITAEQAASRWWLRKYAPFVRSAFSVGVDLGQVSDPSAIAVVEVRTPWRVDLSRSNEHRPGRPEFHCRHLQRLPLGLPYPAQAAHVRSVVERVAAIQDEVPPLWVDQTGVGRPVLEIFEMAGLRPKGVTITGGERAETSGGWRVPKLELVSTLQAKLHAGELKIARQLPEAKALAAELQEFRAAFTAAGSMTFGARVGRHDDLVLAVAIALWGSTKAGSGFRLINIRVGA